MNIERIDPGPRMSQAVVCGDLVFTAGQVAEKSAGAAVGIQTQEVLEGIDALCPCRQRPHAHPVGHRLSSQHGRFRRHERGLRHLGGQGEPAGTGLRPSTAGGQ